MLRLSQLYQIDLGFDNWDVNIYRFSRFCKRFSVWIEFLCTRFAVWIEFLARNSQQFFTTIEPD